MNYDFDQVIARRNKSSLKWDAVRRTSDQQEIIPMWVADMDFASPPEVIAALKERVEHGVFGYSFRSESHQAKHSMYQAFMPLVSLFRINGCGKNLIWN